MNYYQKNRDIRLTYQKQYYQDNKQEIIQYTKNYYSNNKEILKQKRKEKYKNKNGKNQKTNECSSNDGYYERYYINILNN